MNKYNVVWFFCALVLLVNPVMAKDSKKTTCTTQECKKRECYSGCQKMCRDRHPAGQAKTSFDRKTGKPLTPRGGSWSGGGTNALDARIACNEECRSGCDNKYGGGIQSGGGSAGEVISPQKRRNARGAEIFERNIRRGSGIGQSDKPISQRRKFRNNQMKKNRNDFKIKKRRY